MKIDGKVIGDLPLIIEGKKYCVFIPRPSGEFSTIEIMIGPLDLIRSTIEEVLAKKIAEKHRISFTTYKDADDPQRQHKVFAIWLNKTAKNWEEYTGIQSAPIAAEIDQAQRRLVETLLTFIDTIDKTTSLMVGLADL